jgi:phenylacetate-coenzyme A ligase PaaK-like adenylate-forming protein
MEPIRDRKAAAVAGARDLLDAHVRETVAWHFSPETGCPFWLDWKAQAGWDPVAEVRGFDDLRRFDHFKDEWLRDEKNERFVPKAFAGRPFNVFETGGTTGLPKQRIGWDDYKHDYEQFSATLDDNAFPRGGNWIMVGPTGPRRLRLAVEHLANIRGGSCYFIDLDPRWVKKLIAKGHYDQAEAYQRHVIDQAVEIIKHRDIQCMFTTPKLLESIAERISLPGRGVKGVFCGGTTMTPQMTRFLVEEVCEGKTRFVPTYGNTLMGLAHSRPLSAEEGYSITYYAPQPRAVLRVVVPDDPDTTVGYGEYGRVELTTLTKEFFMPRFLERDEAIRREPYDERYAWDGVGDVRPFGVLEKKIVEGVY